MGRVRNVLLDLVGKLLRHRNNRATPKVAAFGVLEHRAPQVGCELADNGWWDKCISLWRCGPAILLHELQGDGIVQLVDVKDLVGERRRLLSARVEVGIADAVSLDLARRLWGAKQKHVAKLARRFGDVYPHAVNRLGYLPSSEFMRLGAFDHSGDVFTIDGDNDVRPIRNGSSSTNCLQRHTLTFSPLRICLRRLLCRGNGILFLYG